MLHQMLFDDLIHIFAINIGVPDVIRVNHDDWTLGAAIQAACCVDSYFACAGQAHVLYFSLGVSAYLAGIALLTTGLATFTLIGAKKYVIFIKSHELPPKLMSVHIACPGNHGQYCFMRTYTTTDQFLMHIDTALRTVLGKPLVTQRNYPAQDIDDCELDETERKNIAGMMRVNHAGEVSAQALYQGQSITARNADVRSKLEQAALEENDHLAWTENRLHELGDRTSLLSPIWYAGSFVIGAAAGALGDKINLGFLAETEHQVVRHLEDHLKKIPSKDKRSHAILEQMKVDEAKHATTALNYGGGDLPTPVKKLMVAMSKVMTKTAFWV